MNLNPISFCWVFFSEKPNLVIEAVQLFEGQAPRTRDPGGMLLAGPGFLDDFSPEKDRETEMVADRAAAFGYIALLRYGALSPYLTLANHK